MKKYPLKKFFVVKDEFYPYIRIFKSRTLTDFEYQLPVKIVQRYNKAQKEFEKANELLQTAMARHEGSLAKKESIYQYTYSFATGTKKNG